MLSFFTAYRSFGRFWQARHPPRYATFLRPPSPRFGHSSPRREIGRTAAGNTDCRWPDGGFRSPDFRHRSTAAPWRGPADHVRRVAIEWNRPAGPPLAFHKRLTPHARRGKDCGIRRQPAADGGMITRPCPRRTHQPRCRRMDGVTQAGAAAAILRPGAKSPGTVMRRAIRPAGPRTQRSWTPRFAAGPTDRCDVQTQTAARLGLAAATRTRPTSAQPGAT